MNERMIPLLIILMVWVFSRITRGSQGGKNKKGAPAAGPKPAARPAAPAGAPKSASAPGMDARFRKEFPDLFRDVPAPQPGTGSLSADSGEGHDPCHDDYRAMPVGSLGADTGEGKDPCHDGMEHAVPKAAPREDEGAAVSGGLNLDWTGSEIVKGFVYGEILKRKAG